MMRFDWDPKKAKSNLKKHGVSFEEASTVFADDFAKVFFDEIHSDVEIREIIVGYSIRNQLLVVCFTETGIESIRIITARKPTRPERKDYEN